MNIKEDNKFKKIYDLGKGIPYVRKFLNELNIDNFPYDEDVLYEILSDVIYYYEPYYIDDYLNISIELYNIIGLDKNDEVQLKVFKSIIINKYYKNMYNQYFYKIYELFVNKELFLSILRYFDDMNIKFEDIAPFLYKYIYKVRNYYIDERSLYSSILNVINEIENVNCDEEQGNKIIEKNINEAQIMSGLYKMDEKKLKEIQNLLNQLSSQENKLEETIDKKTEIIENLFNKVKNKIEENDHEEKQADYELIFVNQKRKK